MCANNYGCHNWFGWFITCSQKTSVLAVLLLTVNIVSAEVKVAFIADQGTSRNANNVLQLIAEENAQLLLIQGDLGYKKNTAAGWEDNLIRILGPEFPVLAVVGNHENYEWNEYKQILSERIAKISEMTCEGDIGVKALCNYDALSIVQVAPGIDEVDGVLPEDDYPQFILDSFHENTSKWRICSWHKNQSLMQIGQKGDETGWGVYEACLNVGALIATGHSHTYSRTHLLSSFKEQTVVNTSDHLVLEKGRSFAFVNGLGGKKIREQKSDGDWWAASYSRTQGAKHGALFCTFKISTAECYFKSISGIIPFTQDIPDTFTLESLVGSIPR